MERLAAETRRWTVPRADGEPSNTDALKTLVKDVSLHHTVVGTLKS